MSSLSEITVASTVGKDVPLSTSMSEPDIKVSVEEIPICFDLCHGGRKHYLEYGVPLYTAAMEGDWKTAERILHKHRNLATEGLDRHGKKNILHLAAGANSSSHFIKKLVEEYMSRDDLALKSNSGCTALLLAAQSGNNVEVAKCMVEKNDDLPHIQAKDGVVPLTVAAMWGYPHMATYLLSVTDLQRLSESQRYELLHFSIDSELYDIALHVVEKFPELALWKTGDGGCALKALAKKQLKSHSTQGSSWTKWGWTHEERQNQYGRESHALKLIEKLWGRVLDGGTREQIAYFSQSLIDAAAVDNVEFIARIVRTFPELLWYDRGADISVFHVAILNRQVEVFSLIYETGGWKGILLHTGGASKTTTLHMAADLPRQESFKAISGAALQMQRELLWFKEVEKLTPWYLRRSQNRAGKTPQSLFSERHKELRNEGEKWLKTNARSWSIVATLIAIVGFTTAYTVPGGDDQERGLPFFQRDPIFVVFAIADALSFSLSSIALLMFLAILTSRYAEEEFLQRLPCRLLVGLTALFFSISFMMVAFASTFFIVFKAGLPLLSIPFIVAVLAAAPVAIFASEQFPLLIEIYRSTYRAKYLFGNHRRIYRHSNNNVGKHHECL